jgi:hypothetical protein
VSGIAIPVTLIYERVRKGSGGAMCGQINEKRGAYMRRCLFLFLALFLALNPLAQAEQAETEETLHSAEQVLSERVSILQIDADVPPAFVRAAYEIDLSSEEQPKEIAQFYGSYDSVIVLEYGYYRIYPIVSSCTFAVGIMPDGTMEECKTPMGIVSRIFDYAPLRQLRITEIPLEP